MNPKATPLKTTPLVFAALLAVNTAIAHARLGENEQQTSARYGAPVPPPADALVPLIAGAKEMHYESRGWRIRAAYMNNVTVRIEYSKADKSIGDEEIDAILKDERGPWKWKAANAGGKARPDPNASPAPIAEERTREWIRGDKATAKLHEGDTSLLLSIAVIFAQGDQRQNTVTK